MVNTVRKMAIAMCLMAAVTLSVGTTDTFASQRGDEIEAQLEAHLYATLQDVWDAYEAEYQTKRDVLYHEYPQEIAEAKEEKLLEHINAANYRDLVNIVDAYSSEAECKKKIADKDEWIKMVREEYAKNLFLAEHYLVFEISKSNGYDHDAIEKAQKFANQVKASQDNWNAFYLSFDSEEEFNDYVMSLTDAEIDQIIEKNEGVIDESLVNEDDWNAIYDAMVSQ